MRKKILLAFFVIFFLAYLPHSVFASKAISGYYHGASGSSPYLNPAYRLWADTSWGSETNATALDAGSDIEWMALKCDANQTNCIMGTLDDEGEVQAQAYTGGAWGSVVDVALNIGTINDQARGFDVAFEYARGWGLVISANNTAKPYYDIWYPGNNTWSGVQQFPASACGTSGTPNFVEAASKPNANEILMAYMDNSSPARYCGYVWDGSSWGNSKSIFNSTPAETVQKTLCVAYEQTSGEAHVLLDRCSSADLQIINWTGSAWQVPSMGSCGPAGTSEFVWIQCASMPGSDRILMVSPLAGGAVGAGNPSFSYSPLASTLRDWSEATKNLVVKKKTPRLSFVVLADLYLVEWGGSAFGTSSTLATVVEGDLIDRQLADVAYLGGSGWGQVVYAADANFPKERRCMGSTGCSNGSTGWTAARDTTASICGNQGTGSNQTDLMRLVQDTSNNDTMLVYSTQSSTEPICSQLYNGSTNSWGSISTFEDTNRFLANARPFDVLFYNTSNAAPAFVWQQFNITNGSAYSQQTIAFFADFTDDNGTSSVTFTFRHLNGTIINYTMSAYNGSSTNGVWNYNLSSIQNLREGTYYFNYTASDGDKAKTSGDFSLVLYSNSTIGIAAYYQSSSLAPKFRNWTAGWSDEGSATSGASLGENLEWARIKCSPLENTCILATLIDVGKIYAQTWRNNSWGTLQTVAANIGTTNDNYSGFDVAFENSRGWGLVITANNSDTPYYRIWYPENNTWSSTAQFQVNDSCAGTPVWLEAHSKPSSDEIIVTYSDTANDVCSSFWNGSQFGAPVLHTASTFSTIRKTFCNAYEQNSGEASVLYETLSGSLKQQIHYVNNDTWSSAASVGVGSLTGFNWLECPSRPASDRVLAAISYRGTSQQVDAIEWNGSAWGTQTTLGNPGAAAETFQDRKSVDAAYLGASGGAMVVYPGRYQNAVLERRCTTASNCFAGTWSSARNTSSDICGTGNGGGIQTDATLVRLVPDPFSNNTILLYSTNHTNEPICGQHYNSSSDYWSQLTLFEDTNSINPLASDFDFAFNFTGTNNLTIACRDIHAGESLTITQNVSLTTASGRGVCFDFIGGSASLTCSNGGSQYYVIDSTGSTGIGIRGLGRDSLTVTNCPLLNFSTHAQFINSTGSMTNVNATYGYNGFNLSYNAPTTGAFNVTNATVRNMTFGLMLSGLNFSRFTSNDFKYLTYGIDFSSNANNNTFFNTTIYNVTTTAIKANGAGNFTFVELLLSQTPTVNGDLNLQTSLNNYFLSANINPSTTSLVTANYTVAYYARANVTFCENYSAFKDANVSFFSTQARFLDSAVSAANGFTDSKNVSSFAEYYDSLNDLEVTVNYTPHKFYANASGLVNDTQTVYFSTNTTQAMCLNVIAVLDISLVNNTVNFSTVNVGNDYYSDNASGLSYRYFILQNDGNVAVNVTTTATAPFSRNTTPMPGAWYRFNASDYETGSLAANCPSPFTKYNIWYNVNETGQSGVPHAMCRLGYVDTADAARIAINWRIANDEPAGAKTSTATFTASQS